jgi:copper resistance protein B
MTGACRLMAGLALAGVMAGAPAAVAQTPPAPPPADPHAGHQPAAPASPGVTEAEAQDLPPFIPVPTDADRAAAFPDVHRHETSDNAVNWQVLFDQLEWQQGGRTDDVSWDTTSWLGTDIHRVWFRAEGDRAKGRFEQAQLQLLYGRAVSRWWQAVAGVRQDLRAGAPRTAAALGLVGLAPYWFHVEASLFAEPNGRAHLRLETEYELLVTNRLVLQPLAEVEIYTRPDREQQLGRGLSTLDAGVRLRYEIRREFAPYVGVVWHRTFFETSTLHRAAGRRDQGVAAVVGVRVWR